MSSSWSSCLDGYICRYGNTANGIFRINSFFAEFNVPKFKQISGSLKNAFGVQRIVPVVEQPKGTTVLSLNFSSSPSPSVTKQMTQQTTTIEQPELEQKQKEKDSDGGETDKKDRWWSIRNR